MTRITPLGVSLATVVAWGLVLAVVSGRVELALVTVPLVVALLRVAGPATFPRCTVRHAVSADRVFEGERVRVTITLDAAGPGLVEVAEPLPPTVGVVAGASQGLVGVRKDDPATVTYEICGLRRGPVPLGTIHLRLWGAGGLRARETTVHDPKLLRVYPRAQPVRRLPRPRRTQTSVGNYVARSVGDGLEPGEIRGFVPGDRIRHVNWRASLRWQQLYVTQYQHERNADVVLMLDSLAEVGEPPRTTLDVSIRAAASLAAAYLARKDRVGVIEYGGFFHAVRPASGRAHHERVLDALFRADVAFSYVARDIALVPERLLPPAALVVAISPLLDRRFDKAVADLAARRFDVVILSPSPIPLVEPAGPSAATRLAARVWRIERAAHADRLRRLGLSVVDWHPDAPLDVALDGLARQRRYRTLGTRG